MNDNKTISFINTIKRLREINYIINDIKKVRDNKPLNRHEELYKILLSNLIVQYTQEFNDNAEIIWGNLIKKNENIQSYNDSKRELFNQYIGYTELIIFVYRIDKFNEINVKLIKRWNVE